MTEIKKIEAGDLPDLALLYEELAEKPTDLAVMERNFEWIDRNGDYIVLGAKSDGKLVGTLMGLSATTWPVHVCRLWWLKM